MIQKNLNAQPHSYFSPYSIVINKIGIQRTTNNDKTIPEIYY